MTRRKRKPPSPGSTAPNAMPATPEYAQHHDLDARPAAKTGNAGWRVMTRLDGLMRSNDVSAAEYQAGDCYRRDYEMGELGCSPAAPGEGGGGSGCPTSARLDALGRLSAARSVLSVTQRIAADAVAVDMSWAALGGRLGCGRDRAKGEAVAALQILAGHYRLYGEGRRMRTGRAA